MGTKLIYHVKEVSAGGILPFDKTIPMPSLTNIRPPTPPPSALISACGCLYSIQGLSGWGVKTGQTSDMPGMHVTDRYQSGDLRRHTPQ